MDGMDLINRSKGVIAQVNMLQGIPWWVYVGKLSFLRAKFGPLSRRIKLQHHLSLAIDKVLPLVLQTAWDWCG